MIEALRQVEDPELGMDIVDLGLLYDVEIDGSKVKVIHSLTSMGCPAGPMIQEDIHRVASEVPGVENVEVELTWDPPWTPDKMSDDAEVHPRLRLAGNPQDDLSELLAGFQALVRGSRLARAGTPRRSPA